MSIPDSLSSGSMLTLASPAVSEPMAADIVTGLYGIKAKARLLTSERDANFHVLQGDAQCFVLKITNAAEPPELTNLQTAALLHIQEKDPDLPVPRVVPSLDGRFERPLEIAGAAHVVRLLTYLQGKPLHLLDNTRLQRANIGECLGRLGLALKDFSHPAGDHDLLWDIKNTCELRPLTRFIPDRARRRRVEDFVDRFEAEIAPQFPRLRKQIVHNDFNPHNILMDAGDQTTVSGVIDFGDIVRTPLINDLAVAASYHVQDADHPLDGIVDLVGAYHKVAPLLPLEIDVLFDLIIARFVTTVVITHWRAEQHPNNSAYILRNNPRAWLGIERFGALNSIEARRILANACDLEIDR